MGGEGAAICSGIVCLIVFILTLAMLISSIHKVDEGNIGIYYKNGALQDHFKEPGIHTKAPFVSEVLQIPVRTVTDVVPDIKCVTKDGITNTFAEIQVINTIKKESVIGMVKNFGKEFKKPLIFDRVSEEVRLFCANNTIDEVYNTKFMDIVGYVDEGLKDAIAKLGSGGITIDNLMIPKPDIPADIEKNYQEVKVQWTEQLVEEQRQQTELLKMETKHQLAVKDAERIQATEIIKKQTENNKKTADAQRQQEILKIEIEMAIEKQNGEKDQYAIQDEMLKKRAENEADMAYYRAEKEHEANQLLLTESYIQLEAFRAMASNTKYYFSGDDSLVGAMLSGIFDDGIKGSTCQGGNCSSGSGPGSG